MAQFFRLFAMAISVSDFVFFEDVGDERHQLLLVLLLGLHL